MQGRFLNPTHAVTLEYFKVLVLSVVEKLDEFELASNMMVVNFEGENTI